MEPSEIVHQRLLARAKAFREAAAFCNETPGLVLNKCNAFEFEARAREAQAQADALLICQK